MADNKRRKQKGRRGPRLTVDNIRARTGSRLGRIYVPVNEQKQPPRKRDKKGVASPNNPVPAKKQTIPIRRKQSY